MGKQEYNSTGRRRFLKQVFSAGALTCLGCASLPAGIASNLRLSGQKEAKKFDKECGLSYRDFVRGSFQLNYIPILKEFSAIFGEELFLNRLEFATSNLYSRLMKEAAEKQKDKNLDNFLSAYAEVNATIAKNMDPSTVKRMLQNINTYHVEEKSENTLAFTVSECLFAETFCEADADNIGYLTCCYPDLVTAQAYDSRMKFMRAKILMKGDSCCSLRYTWEG